MKHITTVLICLVLAAVMVAPAFAAGAEAPTDGLVIYYDFDNGEAKDLVGNNTFANIGNATFVDGYKGKAISFDGKGSIYVGGTEEAPLTSPNPNKSFSFSAWIKSNFKVINDKGEEVNQDGALFCWGSFAGATGVWGFVQAGSSNVCLAGYDASGTPALSNYAYAYNYEKEVRVDDNEWHNIIFVYDASKESAVIYIDGQLFDKDGAGLIKEMVVDGFDNHFFLGGRSQDSFYKGLLDEVRIYNRVITAAEAKALAGVSEAPDTADYTAIAVLVAAISGAALVLRKKH
ncbi:MAG: LamG domain-containing protein [Clostridia bacterium]|nr:LamG domain-containing protein [Clostridia bacterium]